MSTQYAFGKIVTNGLVLALDAADRNSYVSGSTTWFDLSGNANNGAFTTSGSNAVSASYSPSNGGNIVFSGTGSYINCGNSSTLTILDNVSVNIWFRINGFPSASSYSGLLAKRTDDSNSVNYGLNFNSTPNDAFQWYYKNAGLFRVLSTPVSTNFSLGVWYNVTGVFSKNGTNTDASIYKNGTLITGSTLLNNVTASSANVLIGSSTTNTEFFNGIISVAQIYNRALSAQEVLQNYNAQKARFGL